MRVLFVDSSKRVGGPKIWKESIIKILSFSKDITPRFCCLNLCLPKNIKKLKNAEIIHFYTLNHNSFLFFLISKILSKKIVFTLHGDFFAEERDKSFIKKLFFVSGYKYVLRNSNLVSFPSNFLANKIVSRMPELSNKFKIIPNGVSPSNLIKNKFNKKDKSLIILSVTNFNYYEKARGILLLSKVFENIRDPNIRINIAGYGKYLEKISRSIKDKRINFLGRREDINKLLANSDVFVHITFLDNLPISILEAMAAGKPIIASDVGGISEMLPSEEVVRNNKFDLLFKFKRIISSVEYRKKLIKRNLLIVQKFYWERVAKQLVSFYKSVNE